MPDFRKTLQTALIGVFALLQVICLCHGNFCSAPETDGNGDFRTAAQVVTHEGRHGHTPFCRVARTVPRPDAPVAPERFFAHATGVPPAAMIQTGFSGFPRRDYPPPEPERRTGVEFFLDCQKLLC